MQPTTPILAQWHDFFMLLGTASATMVGLLFVAVSVGARAFSQNRRGAVRIFLTASVVHFSSCLATSLIVLAPIADQFVQDGAIVLCGVFGVAYSAMAWRDTAHDGLRARIDLEDRTWYALLPAVAYVAEAGAGTALFMRTNPSCYALAAAVGSLLLIAIHNAWDITVWSVTRRDN